MISTFVSYLESIRHPESLAETSAESRGIKRAVIKNFGALLLVAATLTSLLALLEILIYIKLTAFITLASDGMSLGEGLTSDIVQDRVEDVLILFAVTPLVVISHSFVLNQIISSNLTFYIFLWAYNYLIGSKYSSVVEQQPGAVASKLYTISSAGKDVLLKIVDALVHIVAFMIFSAVLIGRLSPEILVPIGIWCVVQGGTLVRLLKKLSRQSRLLAEKHSELSGALVDELRNFDTVKLHSYDEGAGIYIKAILRRVIDESNKKMRSFSIVKILIWCNDSLLILGVFLLSVYSCLQGNMMIGDLAFATAVVLRLSGLSHWLMWETFYLYENVGAIRACKDVISFEAESDCVGADTTKIEKVTLEDVSLKKEGAMILTGISMELLSGQSIGIIGPSGSGKSSLVNVMCGLIDSSAGEINYWTGDRKRSATASRRQMRVITQNMNLLNRSIFENAAYGSSNATPKEVKEVLLELGLGNWLAGLPSGLSSVVNDSTCRLSGGQRQRLLIARALLSVPDVLILDEATSALDKRSEEIVFEVIQRRLPHALVINITHRVHQLRNYDHIYVIKDGSIAASGNYASLRNDSKDFSFLLQDFN